MQFHDFHDTASVLVRINPSVAEKGYTAQTLEAHMQRFAYDLREEGHFTGSTFGYVLSLFVGSDGEMNCRASVSAYTVDRFILRAAWDRKVQA